MCMQPGGKPLISAELCVGLVVRRRVTAYCPCMRTAWGLSGPLEPVLLAACSPQLAHVSMSAATAVARQPGLPRFSLLLTFDREIFCKPSPPFFFLGGGGVQLGSPGYSLVGELHFWFQLATLVVATGCSLNIVCFPLNFVIFLTSVSSAAAQVFYLPGVCTTHTDTEGKQRQAIVRNILKSSIKHNM